LAPGARIGRSKEAIRSFPLNLYIVFALAERKNDIQKEAKYRCESPHLRITTTKKQKVLLSTAK
jgi:hypothetical protein